MKNSVIFGLDVGTTSVSGVAVDGDGRVIATATRAHEADLPSANALVDEQDPQKLLSAARTVIDELKATAGVPAGFGWTGQMHGVVAVDRELKPITPFVTWRDARRYGGRVMADWARAGLKPYVCLCAPGFISAALGEGMAMDVTFFESWHVEPGVLPDSWMPPVEECGMIGDNQAGVFAAQKLMPGSAVVNLGTSGQFSVVVDRENVSTGTGIETRRYPYGKALVCRASLVGGQLWSALHRKLGISWEEMNQTAEMNREIRECADRIVDDLVVGMDLGGVSSLVGIGNAIRLNPALQRAVERKFGMRCFVPEVMEVAAYGAALYKMELLGLRQ